MVNPDQGLRALEQIIDEFKAFCASRGSVSEADTRVKVVDRVLREVLGWDESAIAREETVRHETDVEDKQHYTDYSLSVGEKRFVIIEAKKESVAFTFPVGNRKTYSL